ncbi:phage repressor protein [Comamonadaceae bacterium OH2310_COT-174]|nr:phage repressor protein [Comamonadaceae bacterium OH2310_COT-174]
MAMMYAIRVIVRAKCVKVKRFFCEMHKSSVADVLARLQALFNVESDSALASAMEVNRQTLGSWRARGRVPYEECINLAIQRGLSLDWLLIGEGPMRRSSSDLSAETEREGAVLSLLRQLPDADQQEIELAAQTKKRLLDAERRLEQMTKDLAASHAAKCSH